MEFRSFRGPAGLERKQPQKNKKEKVTSFLTYDLKK